MATLQAGPCQVSCRAILFDKDGTLFQFMALWGNWANAVLKKMEEKLASVGQDFQGAKSVVFGTEHDHTGNVCGYDPKGPLAMATIEETNGLLAWQLYAAGIPWNEALVQSMEICDQATLEMRQSKPANPMPGLLNFLQDCQAASIQLGVVTSDDTSFTVEQLGWAEINQYFQVIIGRDQVSLGKPHPEMIEKASLVLGVDPQNIVVIGDTNADMQMAKRAGVKLAIGISTSSEQPGSLLDADVMISNYDELKVNK